MFRKVILSFLFSSYLLAQEVGIMAIYKSAIYQDLEDKKLLLPFVRLNYNQFYLNGLELGYRLNIISIFLHNRMGDKKNTIEAGVRISNDIGYGSISSTIFYGIFDYGYLASIEYKTSNKYINPYVGVEYLNERFLDYYYELPNFSNAINTYGGIRTNYPLSKDIGIFLDFKVKFFDKKISNSLNEDREISSMLGISYKF